ncbi:MAG: ABC transporter substrate-binding protein [Bacteroidales bacterium]|nr:ABC transporter substrate-binding protein [Bacteroidales bacterium]
MQKYKIILLALLVASCSFHRERPSEMEYAQWFKTLDSASVVVYSPYGGADTLQGPMDSFVCMSSSYVGYLDAIGAACTVKGVSGLGFIGTPGVEAVEVGYDAALDYEAILGVKPDLFITYTVSAVEPPYLAKLRELGVPTVILSEHLESHPLARAEYVKLFGALTGRYAAADSVFAAVRDRYLSLVREPSGAKVLLNIPYADIWYIPGGDNYMTRLIRDAGGEVLGAVPGRQESSTISVEKAYSFAQEAGFWLNTGWCNTRRQLLDANHIFSEFSIPEVWNNTLQTTPGGGNLFWETGPVRPDLVLEDLVQIFSGTESDSLNYYLRVL